MNPVYQFAWVLWIGGTILIIGSWVDAIPVHIGWVGFGIALAGTLLSIVSERLSSSRKAPQPRFLCDSCRLHHGNVCWRKERPNAQVCPDYQQEGG